MIQLYALQSEEQSYCKFWGHGELQDWAREPVQHPFNFKIGKDFASIYSAPLILFVLRLCALYMLVQLFLLWVCTMHKHFVLHLMTHSSNLGNLGYSRIARDASHDCSKLGFIHCDLQISAYLPSSAGKDLYVVWHLVLQPSWCALQNTG